MDQHPTLFFWTKLVHHDRKREGLIDSGGYSLETQRQAHKHDDQQSCPSQK